MQFVSDLNTPLLRLSRSDDWTVEDSFRSVLAFGGIGQGKTSGLGEAVSGAYLRGGYGGVITAVKPGEIDLWKRRAAKHGRSNSLIIFDENEGFNFLDYELARGGGLEGIGTLTEYLMKTTEAGRRASGTASKRGEPAFWEDSTRMLSRYTLPALYAAYGTVSVDDIIRFVSSAPRSRKEAKDAEWQKSSFAYKTLWLATNRPKVKVSEHAMKAIVDYWAESFVATADETRENIVTTITASLDRFRHGRLQKAFCGKTSIVPEMCFSGALIVLAMPTLTWFEDGVIAQQLFKFAFQRAVLGRNALAPKFRDRPVFLYSDEAQEVVSSYDGEFLGLTRESKCSVAYLSQSLPTFIAKCGGDSARESAMGLIGKFGTQVFFGNPCAETNEYSSRLIGKVVTRRNNYSRGASESVNVGMSSGENESWGSNSNYGSSSGNGHSSSNSGSGSNKGSGTNWGANRGRGVSENESRGYSESMEYAFEPGDFARILKSGGKANNYEVTGVWFQSSRRFNATGTNYLLETFKQ